MATKKTGAKKTVASMKKSMSARVDNEKIAPAARKAAKPASVPKMTKTQVIRYMAERMEVPPKQIGVFFALLIETATTQTRDTGEFTIPGLGKLVKAERKARIGRNPATGDSIQIAAKTTVKFRLAKATQEAVVSPKR